MTQLLISLLIMLLLLASGFVVLIVLMQRTGQGGGMGAALGGGAAESAFGAETNDVLTKVTIYSIIVFFVLALGLFLLFQANANEELEATDPIVLSVPEEVPVPEPTAPETTADLEVTTAEDLFENAKANEDLQVEVDKVSSNP
ncbi:MAG: Protein-export membrane protein SecG [Opitutia bacterium UBA7350]|nr:MAG: Protein-export membrane protein SecG [Opitutae bacterium UBA7350]